MADSIQLAHFVAWITLFFFFFFFLEEEEEEEEGNGERV